jgi:hypothetical protein
VQEQSGGGAGQVFAATATDTLSLADSTRPVAVRGRLVADGVAASDQTLLSVGRRRLAADQLSLLDAALRSRTAYRTAADGLSFSDLATGIRNTVRIVPDALVLIDEGQATRRRNRLLTDSAQVTDAAAATRRLTRALTDSLSMFDAALAKVSGLTVRVATDEVLISDGVQVVRVLRRVLTDGFALTDDAVRVLRLLRRQSDSVALTDSALTGQSATISKVGTDVVRVTDAVDLFAVRSRDVRSLIVALTDAAMRAVVTARTGEDWIAVGDQAAARLRRMMLLSDTFEVSDGVATVSFRHRQLSDFLDVYDDTLSLYIPEASQRYVVRVLIGAHDTVVLGAE